MWQIAAPDDVITDTYYCHRVRQRSSVQHTSPYQYDRHHGHGHHYDDCKLVAASTPTCDKRKRDQRDEGEFEVLRFVLEKE